MDPISFQDPVWYHATTLTERVATLGRGQPRAANGAANVGPARRRLQRWRSQPPFQAGPHFTQRLAREGISEEDLLCLLGEPVEAVRERFPGPPDWLSELDRAFTQHASSAGCSPPPPEWWRGQQAAGFLVAIGPLLRRGRDRLREGIQALSRAHSPLPFDPATVEGVLLANLPGQLIPMLSRTLALELNVARLQGLLQGDTAEERFQSFVRRLGRRDVALALLGEYPVLARHLMTGVTNWVTFHLEFLRHLCADWEALRAALTPGNDPGGLVRVTGGMGDGHRGGRSVMVATFGSGFQAVYKPKSLAVDVHFQELLTWLNERGDHPPFRTLRVLNRGTYGWVEFVARQDCTSDDEVRRFYERQGGYLALLYALEATDFHSENLIAAGEHPVLIDLEALFHPRSEGEDVSRADQLAGTTMGYSVLRVGLLPQRMWSNAESEGVDISGLGGAAGQLTPQAVPYWEGAGTDEMRLARKRVAMAGSQHRPTLRGQEVDVLDHADSVAAGFSRVYQVLLEHRDELLSEGGPLACFAEDEVRVIFRPTRTYGLLLQESFHPDLLRSALDRDRFFDRLWVEVGQRPHLARLIAAEQADLHNGDIPMFTTRARSRDVWDSANGRSADFFEESGMALVSRRLRQLSDDDQARQSWFLRASLATLSTAAEPARQPAGRRIGRAAPADRETLLTAARAVGDRLDRLALRGTDDATWIGLTLVKERQWSLLPLGPSLYDGLPGVALFLAYLGALTGEERYTGLARAAVRTLLRQLERAPSALTTIGGFDGWGGVIYALAHLGTLWDQPALLAEAEEVVKRLPPLIERDEVLDLIGGAAGCILSLLSLYQRTPSEGALEAAIQCGDRLLARGQVRGEGLAWATPVAAAPLTGFAHGAAGMARALLELGARTGQERFPTAARAAIAYERGLFSPAARNWPDLRDPASFGQAANNGQPPFGIAWCHGAPGIGLARLGGLRHFDDAATRAEIDAALETTLAHGFGSNHSLCHGDLGNLELLLQASELLPDARWHAAVGGLAAVILESIGREGWLCGLPSKVESPGLMTGLAGIGYGLLRLADPGRVPSVLVLDPPS